MRGGNPTFRFRMGPSSVVLIALGWALQSFTTAPAVAQSADCSHRKSEIKLVSDGFASPDIATQLDTLDKAMRTKCPLVRRIALTQAFASSDATLRSAALIAAISTSKTLIVQVLPGVRSNGDEGKAVSDGSHGRFVLNLTRYDHGADSVELYTDASARRDDKIMLSPGSLAGDRFSFSSLSVPGVGAFSCDGVLYLKESARLEGDMACGPWNAKAKIELMK